MLLSFQHCSAIIQFPASIFTEKKSKCSRSLHGNVKQCNFVSQDNTAVDHMYTGQVKLTHLVMMTEGEWKYASVYSYLSTRWWVDRFEPLGKLPPLPVG
jgi:hypothetical protein